MSAYVFLSDVKFDKNINEHYRIFLATIDTLKYVCRDMYLN